MIFAAGASHTLAHTEYIWNYWSCAIHLRTSLRFVRNTKSKLSFFWSKTVKEKFYAIYNRRDVPIGRYAWRTQFAVSKKWKSTWLKLDENKISSWKCDCSLSSENRMMLFRSSTIFRSTKTKVAILCVNALSKKVPLHLFSLFSLLLLSFFECIYQCKIAFHSIPLPSVVRFSTRAVTDFQFLFRFLSLPFFSCVTSKLKNAWKVQKNTSNVELIAFALNFVMKLIPALSRILQK